MRRRAVAQHASDEHALAGLQVEGLGDLGREVTRLDTDPAPRDTAFADQAVHHLPGGGNGDGKTDAHVAARAGVDGRVDADQVAIGVDQRSARVARVDGRVGLDEVLEGVDAQLVAPQSADDAAGHGLADTKGVADGQHRVAHLQGLGIAQGDGGQALQVDFEHGQVGFGVGANDLGARTAAIGEHHLDLVHAIDHMVVGQHVPFRRDDDARADARLRLLVGLAKEVAEPGVTSPSVALLRVGRDHADHRGGGLTRGIAEAQHRLAGPASRQWRRAEGGIGEGLPPRHLLDPLRLERGHDEQNGHRDRHGLRK